MMIIQYLVDCVEYDMNYYDDSSLVSSNAYSAYGALVDGLAVCDGYSAAFKELASACGLKSEIVRGTANGMGGWGNHSWNRVRLEGEWYHVDVTWEDRDSYYGFGNLFNKYINLT